ncbi:MAG TPA: NAD-dependent epimerase/dehydratase family protein [Bryobacteraceae bacterium]|nr:NAD-dependent epimerase/dehydratase family protein [Bryobacteraceae bacterium]
MTGIAEAAGWYRGEHVLVTGGLGFIGSNLALALAHAGARVTVVDSREPGCGANPFNLHEAESDISMVHGDIADERLIAGALLASDVIFNLAGEVSHTHSMLFPERDFRINAEAQLRFLRACTRYAKGRRVVYASTRQVYGKPKRLPVSEKHQVMAVDYNGVHKHAAGQYHLLMSRQGEIDAVVLRLTNIYGPRMAIGLPCQGFLPVFFRRAMEGRQISVFGDGGQLRDPVYVDDACEALLLAGAVEAPAHRILNIGSTTAVHSVGEIAEEISRQAALPPFRLQAFPTARKKIDIGSYVSSDERATAVLGWRARTDLSEGVRRTLAYYRDRCSQYRAAEEGGGCPLGHLAAMPVAASAT